jgi:hypothetical protein
MKAIATVDWLITKENCERNLAAIKMSISQRPMGDQAAERKSRIFSEKLLQALIDRLKEFEII